MGINPHVLVLTDDGELYRIYECGCQMYLDSDEQEWMLSVLCEGHKRLALLFYAGRTSEGS